MGPFEQHAGAHQCPHGRVEGQDCEPAIVSATFEVAVDQAVSQAGKPRRYKIHEQERDVVHGVNPAQRRRELQAVEWRGSSLDHDDVAQMEVAMTFSNVSGAPA